jgi:hypothetical protein
MFATRYNIPIKDEEGNLREMKDLSKDIYAYETKHYISEGLYYYSTPKTQEKKSKPIL